MVSSEPSSLPPPPHSLLTNPPGCLLRPGRGGEGVVVGGDIGHDGTLGKGDERREGGREGGREK